MVMSETPLPFPESQAVTSWPRGHLPSGTPERVSQLLLREGTCNDRSDSAGSRGAGASCACWLCDRVSAPWEPARADWSVTPTVIFYDYVWSSAEAAEK